MEFKATFQASYRWPTCDSSGSIITLPARMSRYIEQTARGRVAVLHFQSPSSLSRNEVDDSAAFSTPCHVHDGFTGRLSILTIRWAKAEITQWGEANSLFEARLLLSPETRNRFNVSILGKALVYISFWWKNDRCDDGNEAWIRFVDVRLLIGG